MAATDFHHRRGIATVCLSGTLDDKLTAAAAAGFDGVEIFENDLIAAPETPARIRRRCDDLGLRVDLYQPFRDFEAAPPERHRTDLRRAEHKFDLMRQLGADTILVCSSVAPDTVDDDDLAAAQLRGLADRAADRGLRLAYEALAWGRYVNTFEHSWDLVRRADHPALGLCLDSFHILSRGGDPAGIRDIPGEKLFFLQLADAPQLRMDVLQWSRHHRLFPGQGAFDLTAFLRHVLAAGYRGPLSLEVFNDVFRQSDPHRAAVDAMRSLRSLEETVGVALPDVPELTGLGFTELTVDSVSEPPIAKALAGLGFAHTGDHRDDPVRLWEHDDLRVLLRRTATDDDNGHARVSAVALRCADPETAAGRAAALLAPPAPRPDRPGPPSVPAPDGTAILFSPTDTGAARPEEFIPTGAPPGTGTGLRRVDHLALTQPFDHFDESVLFYRSVLGLRPEADTEFAAPFGLVHCRALADSAHLLRIALSVAVLRRGDEWSPRVTDPQHIAFATDDIFASVAKLRALGAPLLPIPGNYYDDLDARTALPPRRLAALRRHSVLYDRDDDGEFLHCYTRLLGSRVFFEVVQRIGGYAGYGARNAPVRMAAHRRHRIAEHPD